MLIQATSAQWGDATLPPSTTLQQWPRPITHFHDSNDVFWRVFGPNSKLFLFLFFISLSLLQATSAQQGDMTLPPSTTLQWQPRPITYFHGPNDAFWHIFGPNSKFFYFYFLVLYHYSKPPQLNEVMWCCHHPPPCNDDQWHPTTTTPLAPHHHFTTNVAVPHLFITITMRWQQWPQRPAMMRTTTTTTSTSTSRSSYGWRDKCWLIYDQCFR